MNTYKITNITNLLGKRDINYNSTLKIKYVDEMIRKTVDLKSNEVIFLSITSLPLSVHRLRIKNLVSVIEVANKELVREMILAKPPLKPPAKPIKKKPIKKKIVDVEKEKEKKERVIPKRGRVSTKVEEEITK